MKIFLVPKGGGGEGRFSKNLKKTGKTVFFDEMLGEVGQNVAIWQVY